MYSKKNSREEFASLSREIRESSIRDFKDWVNECVTEMEAANEQGQSMVSFTLYVMTGILPYS